ITASSIAGFPIFSPLPAFLAQTTLPSSSSIRCYSPTHDAVWIDDELLRSSLVEVAVSTGRLVQGNDGGVHSPTDLNLVVENCIHKCPVIAHYRTLTGGERKRLRPAQPDPHTQHADFRAAVDSTRVLRHVQPGNPHGTACPRHLHDRVQNGRRAL